MSTQTDIIAAGKVIVEVKCTDHIIPGHRAQMINYLKATGLNVGLIINFGKSKVEYEANSWMKNRSYSC